jgi:tetratricopeptide (TPR) repeat protein
MLFRGEHDAGLELCERAVALNPYNRTVLDLAAVAHLFGGDLDTLIAYAMRAMTLSPGAPDNYGCITHVASAHLSARRFQESLVWAQRSIDLEPGYVYSYLFLAVANAHLGRVEDGLHALETALTIRPDLPLFHANPANRFPDRRQIMIDGYRLLGLQPP